MEEANMLVITPRVIVEAPSEIEGLRVENNYQAIREAMDEGETIMHWEGGFSMHPILMNGEYCKIVPLQKCDGIEKGDAVFCAFNDKEGVKHYMVHRCTDIVTRKDENGDNEKWYRIESTWGDLYGWTNEVYGKALSTNVFEKVALNDM